MATTGADILKSVLGLVEIESFEVLIYKDGGRLSSSVSWRRRLKWLFCFVDDLIAIWMMIELERRQTVYILTQTYCARDTRSCSTGHPSSLTSKYTWVLEITCQTADLPEYFRKMYSPVSHEALMSTCQRSSL